MRRLPDTIHNNKIDELIDRSAELYVSGDYVASLDLSLRALELDSTNSHASYNAGIAALNLGDVSEAVRHLSIAYTHDKNDADIAHSLGEALFEAGQRQKAIRMLRRAVYLNPFASEYQNRLGSVLDATGQFAAAASSLQTYLRSQSTSRSLTNLADVLRHQGKSEEASTLYDAAIIVGDADIQTYNNLILTLNEMGNYGRALTVAEIASRKWPDDCDIMLHRIVALRSSNRTNQAVRLAWSASVSCPNNARIFRELGACLLAISKKTEAQAAFRRTLEIDPEDADAREWLRDILST